MPSTKQVVSWIKEDARGWNRDGAHGILPILNECQNILAQNEAEQMLSYDSSTGSFPLITTQAGVYEYDMPATVWRVNEVLAEYIAYQEYGLSWMSNIAMGSNILPPNQRKSYMGRDFLRIQNVRTVDARYGTNAKVIFNYDPGATSTIYYYRGYTKPVQLTSESIQLTIPEKFHLSHVVPATIKLIEGFQNHTWDKTMAFIEEKYKPDIIKELNKGEQGTYGFIHRREI